VYAATLPCNLLLMACFDDVSVSQGSVATYARCVGIFNIHLTANLPRNLLVKSHTRTVVRECCKGDDESQWERVKFDPPPPPKNPLTDAHQNLPT